MNILTKTWRKLTGVKELNFYARADVKDLFNYTSEEGSIDDYMQKGYGENPYINQVINKISQTVARLPLEYGNPQAEQLIKKPNQYQFKNDFFEAITASLLAGGTAIIYQEETYVGLPDKVEVLNIQYFEPYFDGNMDFMYGIYDRGNGIQTKVLPQEMIVVRFNNILDTGENAWWGGSPLRALKNVYEASNDLFKAQAHLFKNKGAVGFLSSQDSSLPLTPKERDNIDNSMKKRVGGASNYGKILTSSTPLQFVDIGKTPKDLLLNESSNMFLRIICSSMGVDSAIFNDPDNKTYNNRETAERSYYNDVCIPLMDKILEALNYTWNTNIEINLDEILAIQKADEETGIQPESE